MGADTKECGSASRSYLWVGYSASRRGDPGNMSRDKGNSHCFSVRELTSNINKIYASLARFLASEASTTSQVSCRNIAEAALLAVIEARLEAIVNPAWENTRSEGAEVAGMHSMRFAMVASRGNLWQWSFHHCSGLVKSPLSSCINKTGSLLYRSISSWII